MWQRLIMGFYVLAIALASVVAPTALAQQSNNDKTNTKTENYEDWEVRCPTDKADGGCEMTQLVNNDAGKPVMRVVMGYPSEIDTAAMIVILPLGTRLAPGVQIQVDDGEPQTFPFQICLEQGCRADFPVSDSLRDKMRAGSTAMVSLIGPGGDRIDLDVSLQGFTDADNRISRQ